MTLIKTSLLNGINVIVKMLTLLGINKVLAIYVGPSGYAAIGQLQNAVQMISTFATGAINTGVTKYTAEYFNDEPKQQEVWRTAGSLALICSLTSAITIALFNQQLAIWFLKDEDFGGVFIWFAATLVLLTFNALLLAVLNGKKEIKIYVIANIIGSIFALLITTVMVIRFGLYGALVALAVYQSITFFATLLLCYKSPWFKFNYFFGKIDKKTAINLSKYTAMALASAACVPVSQMIIRNHLGEVFGWEMAGYWEAICRMSMAYLMLVTTTLSVYYLPKFSELSSFNSIKKEVFNGYKLILPATFLACLLIYILRDPIITLLFSNEFSKMEELFAAQMIGDFFRIASWVIGYVFISKARFKLFIFIEIFFSFFFIVATYVAISYSGFRGVSFAYAINYIICFLFVLTIFLRCKDEN